MHRPLLFLAIVMLAGGAPMLGVSPVHAQEARDLAGAWPAFDLHDPLAGTSLARDADGPGGSLDERAIAGAASYLLPGAGQFYRGDRGRGALMLGGFAASLVYAVVAGIGEGEICAGQTCQTVPYDVNRRFLFGLGAAVGFHTWSVLDALSHAQR
jgi:hypothetical protein